MWEKGDVEERGPLDWAEMKWRGLGKPGWEWNSRSSILTQGWGKKDRV